MSPSSRILKRPVKALSNAKKLRRAKEVIKKMPAAQTNTQTNTQNKPRAKAQNKAKTPAAKAKSPITKPRLRKVSRTQSRTRTDGAIVRPVFARAELINAESSLGRTIFGPIPAGHHREFFELEKNIWLWHESWRENGTNKSFTVRYEVRESGVYKKLEGSQKNYLRITGDELKNFRKALKTYLKLVREQLY